MAWTLKAKAKACTFEAKAKAKTIDPEAKTIEEIKICSTSDSLRGIGNELHFDCFLLRGYSIIINYT